MTYRQLINKLGSQLEALDEEEEALAFAFKEMKQWSSTDFALHQAQEVIPEDQKLLEEIFDHLKAHKPIQHYLGYTYFMDLILKVTSDVLIPRPETEELVELILTKDNTKPLRVLDIGTGSGAIALALKSKRPNWQVTAVDISEEALKIARFNADNLGLDISFYQSDVFSHLSGRFDIIVSNPPYISEADRHEVGINVLTHEPHQALFAEEDGYAIYKRICQEAPAFLTANGSIYFEIGYKQGDTVKHLLEKHFPEHQARVLKDVFGKDRMVVLEK